ncbi:SGNH/GDSL hydrolase family protein [Geothrix sp. PMB-07]|uniref:SGNH/GDSL hydrolase family protein n=1 Tax=Geothrix sp. PMB-07 TaxID=3068640 RepID=UPI002741583A|nr:SGNH/GDSL hydrolase family protein [Geothrix sp. PMB-07]WLT32251.1 SGNH/GDSL hydrolase family protein [Geothrix sp. PMB-07]
MRRACLGFLLGISASLLLAQAPMERAWVSAWTAPPDSEGPPLKPQTIRQILRPSIGGSSLRIRLSNLFGKAPLTLGPVHVAVPATGSAIQPGSDLALRFGGKPTVTIPVGGSALSDPVPMKVAALQELAISLYLPTEVPASTIHGFGNRTAYLSRGADATAAVAFPPGETDDSRYFLSDVEVAAVPGAQTLVAFGDSITDGVGSKLDGYGRWPDALAARLQDSPATAAIAVVNAGIAGNRILNDGVDPFVGPSGLARFDRDALDKPGARWVLLLSGSNDISASDMLPLSKDQVSAQQIIEGMKRLIARAHAKGLRIMGATLLPKAGVRKPFVHTEAGAAKRRVLNDWIRSSGAFDAIVDFEQVMGDPARPDHLLPAYDSGDHLHPNEAGYQAMAALVYRRLFVEASSGPH